MTQVASSPTISASSGSFRNRQPSNRSLVQENNTDSNIPSSPTSPSRSRRYTLLKTLGTGTYGQVYLCQDARAAKMRSPNASFRLDSPTRKHSQSNLSRSINQGTSDAPLLAVKVANKEAAYRRSALNESKVLQLLAANHETVRWVETYEESGHICIVTELLTKTIYEIMKQRSFAPMALAEVRSVIGNVCRSLSALHRLGYMHCDVKPENIMLRSATEGAASSCLIDFGAVRALSENAYFDIQSLWYRAPEVLCSVPYTPKIDAWSVGCLVFELATGGPLFPGTSAQDELLRIVDMMGSPSQQACANNAGMRYAPGPTAKAEKAIDERIYALHGRGRTSEAVVDLIYQLLNPDESRRISCEEALAHVFLNPKPRTVVPRSRRGDASMNASMSSHPRSPQTHPSSQSLSSSATKPPAYIMGSISSASNSMGWGVATNTAPTNGDAFGQQTPAQGMSHGPYGGGEGFPPSPVFAGQQGSLSLAQQSSPMLPNPIGGGIGPSIAGVYGSYAHPHQHPHHSHHHQQQQQVGSPIVGPQSLPPVIAPHSPLLGHQQAPGYHQQSSPLMLPSNVCPPPVFSTASAFGLHGGGIGMQQPSPMQWHSGHSSALPLAHPQTDRMGNSSSSAGGVSGSSLPSGSGGVVVGALPILPPLGSSGLAREAQGENMW